MQRILLLLAALLLAACNLNTESSGSAPIGTTSPTFGATSVGTSMPPLATPQAMFQSEIGMGTTRVITLERVETIPANTRVRLNSAVYIDGEWCYTITLEGSDSFAEARERQLAWAPGEVPNAPTPTVRFSSDTIGVYRFITTETVGVIPADTRVRISETRFENNHWVYVIVTEDERHTAEAVDIQLMAAPAGTPTSAFLNEMGNGFRFVTTEQVGAIAMNTRVAISQAEMRQNVWVYIIVTEDGRQAEAHDWQLAYAPDVTPGFVPTMTFQSELGMGMLRVITLVNVDEIPANTLVSVSSASFDGREWVYIISDGKTTTEARESQLAYAPGEIPGAPTPTAGLQDAGMGYRFITTEDIGIIPANTLVSVSTMWIQNNQWMYGIMTQDGRYAEARESQLTYAPDITPGFIPTVSFQSELGMGVYRVITLEPVGAIPANTRVRASMATFDGREWVYTIVTRNDVYAEARGSQLTYAPGETPGAPTPMGT